MSQLKYRALIYDCDGVMFDSFEANFAFYSIVLDRFGLPPLDRGDTHLMEVLHTYSSRKVLEHLFVEDGRSGEALAFAGTIDYRTVVPLMRMEDEFVETLESLKGRVNLAVCTNRSTSVDMVLEEFGLAPYFDYVMSAQLVTNPKPHPDMLLNILAHYGLRRDEVLFVGDSQVDRLAAEAAGVPFVAYRNDIGEYPRIDRHSDIFNHLYIPI